VDERADRALGPGSRLAEFEIERVLGMGGFGVTHLATDTQLGRRVAIKEYLPFDAASVDMATNVTYARLVGPNGRTLNVRSSDYIRGRTHFVNEARTLVRLTHAHVVRGHRVLEGPRVTCLVMEYVEGRTLAEELQDGPLPEARVREILTGLADGLGHVHAAGLVHLDVKPSNVMLRADGTPVLIDFGAARQAMAWRSVEEAAERLLPVATVLTPGYAPVEQYNPRLPLGSWTDVYALGALAYEALSGRRPDPAPKRMWADPLPPVAEAASQPVSAALAAAVDEALLPEPGARPRSVRAWRRLLAGDVSRDAAVVAGVEAPRREPGVRPGTLHEWYARFGGAPSPGEGEVVVARAGDDDASVWSGPAAVDEDAGRRSDEGVLPPGTRLEEYSVERVLEVDDLGVTYLARDVSLDAWRVVKQYLPYWGKRRPDGTIGPRTPDDAADYAWGLTRFLDVARVVARFDHPNLVRVYRVFEALGTAHMAREYVGGRTLTDELEETGPLSELRVANVLRDLSDGLAVVHAAGCLHREIKPGNIIVRPDGTPVLDFGLASEATGRHPGMMTVIPGYAPIEQYTQTGRQGPWTDIYALGGVAYWALSGVTPDDAPDRLPEDRMRPLAEVARKPLSAELAAAVTAALAVRAEDRPQSVEEWRAMLGMSRPEDPGSAP